MKGAGGLYPSGEARGEVIVILSLIAHHSSVTRVLADETKGAGSNGKEPLQRYRRLEEGGNRADSALFLGQRRQSAECTPVLARTIGAASAQSKSGRTVWVKDWKSLRSFLTSLAVSTK